MKKERLDIVLVERGLIESRSKALAAIMAGQVFVNGIAVLKAGTAISKESQIDIQLPCPYVSRGGVKLEAALKTFAVNPSQRVCLDVGASTGGFTDCLLSFGARLIYAVDVGHGQMALKIRKDKRVIVREKINARYLKPEDFSPSPTLAVIDVSFISLTQVLGPTVNCLDFEGEIIALIKPQFEVGPKLAPKGIVRTPEAREIAILKIRNHLPSLGLIENGMIESPIVGAKGNHEFLLFLKKETID